MNKPLGLVMTDKTWREAVEEILRRLIEGCNNEFVRRDCLVKLEQVKEARKNGRVG